MTAVRERILAATFAAVGAIDPAVAATVRRNPDADPEHDQVPCIDQYDGGHTASEHGEHGSEEYDLTVDFELLVEGDDLTNAGTALNALYAAVVSALLADVSLGGLSQDIVERGMGVELLRDETGGGRYMAGTLQFGIRFGTESLDPETVAQP